VKYPVTFIYSCQRTKKTVRHTSATAWDMGWFERDYASKIDPAYRIVDRDGVQQWPEQAS